MNGEVQEADLGAAWNRMQREAEYGVVSAAQSQAERRFGLGVRNVATGKRLNQAHVVFTLTLFLMNDRYPFKVL